MYAFISLALRPNGNMFCIVCYPADWGKNSRKCKIDQGVIGQGPFRLLDAMLVKQYQDYR